MGSLAYRRALLVHDWIRRWQAVHQKEVSWTMARSVTVSPWLAVSTKRNPSMVTVIGLVLDHTSLNYLAKVQIVPLARATVHSQKSHKRQISVVARTESRACLSPYRCKSAAKTTSTWKIW
jgi:hypothetical protein